VTPDLVVVHLYPDLLRTYGDTGNVLTLVRRATWRGFRVQVQPVSRGMRLPAGARLVMIGGGTDRVQELVGSDLAARAGELEDAVSAGCVVLGICGGYQLLGREYVTAAGATIAGAGLLDAVTRAGSPRIVGRVRADAVLWGRRFDVAGFENHAGRTSLGPDAAPLATVVRGGGDDGTGRSEGAVQGSVVGTYLHGPVLAINPAFADAVLEHALGARTGGAPLAALPDELEAAAHRRALTLRR
jgi:CobQ-like glutamine amidotransferase family enzyme